jgi:hypothetical protein
MKENQPTPKKNKNKKLLRFVYNFAGFKEKCVFFPEHVWGEVVKLIQSYISLYFPTFVPNKAFKVAENWHNGQDHSQVSCVSSVYYVPTMLPPRTPKQNKENMHTQIFPNIYQI